MSRAMLLIGLLPLLSACRPADQQASSAIVVDTVTAADGVPIVYDVRGHGDVALVFIHCWACDRSFWRDQLDAFAADYRVVALDLAGHGASGKARRFWSIAGLAGDVRAVVEALKLERVILIGHSMGGPVALAAAAEMPTRTVGVVCADAIQNVEYEFPQQAVDQMLAAFSADFAGTMRQMVGSMFPPTADTGLVAWVAARGAAADTAAVLALVRDFPNFNLRRALTEAKVPVRCVNAAPRPPAGPVTTVDINRKYGDFDAVLMDSVGHYLMLERPAEFNAKARAFVEELTGTAEGGR